MTDMKTNNDECADDAQGVAPSETADVSAATAATASDVASEQDFEAAAADESTAEKKPRKKDHKKLAVVLGVIVVVVVAAVVGFNVWHEQPSFCNAICHSPMDPYYESYDQGDGLAHLHKEANVTCLDCHEPTLGEQVSEGWKWVVGDYREPLDMITYDDQTCLKCHISEEFQAAKTDQLEKNPHSDAHQVLSCTDCHKSHDDQVDYCASCHDNGGQRMITWPLEGHKAE